MIYDYIFSKLNNNLMYGGSTTLQSDVQASKTLAIRPIKLIFTFKSKYLIFSKDGTISPKQGFPITLYLPPLNTVVDDEQNIKEFEFDAFMYGKIENGSSNSIYCYSNTPQEFKINKKQEILGRYIKIMIDPSGFVIFLPVSKKELYILSTFIKKTNPSIKPTNENIFIFSRKTGNGQFNIERDLNMSSDDLELIDPASKTPTTINNPNALWIPGSLIIVTYYKHSNPFFKTQSANALYDDVSDQFKPIHGNIAFMIEDYNDEVVDPEINNCDFETSSWAHNALTDKYTPLGFQGKYYSRVVNDARLKAYVLFIIESSRVESNVYDGIPLNLPIGNNFNFNYTFVESRNTNITALKWTSKISYEKIEIEWSQTEDKSLKKEQLLNIISQSIEMLLKP